MAFAAQAEWQAPGVGAGGMAPDGGQAWQHGGVADEHAGGNPGWGPGWGGAEAPGQSPYPPGPPPGGPPPPPYPPGPPPPPFPPGPPPPPFPPGPPPAGPPPRPGRSGAGRVLLPLLALVIAVVLAGAVAQGIRLRRTVDAVGLGPKASTTTSLTIPLASTVPPSTASSTSTSTTVVDTSTTTSTTSTTVASTTAPAPACRNSTDPACGDFRYAPNPANKVMSANVTVSADPAVVGQQITFRMTFTDLDAQPDPLCGPINWGDGTVLDAGACPGAPPPCGAHGPWDPPPVVTTGTTQTFTFQHTYSAPGNYRVLLPPERSHAPKVPEGCKDPYANVVTAAVPVINVN